MSRIFGVLSVLMIGSLSLVKAQDPKAGAILDAMSKRYKAMSSFQAAFTYTAESGSVKETLKGDVTVKGTKFRLKLAGQEVFNNGQTVSTYIKETNEVNISSYDPADNDLNPSRIYSIYKKGYKYLFLEEQKEGTKVYEVVELTPENKASQVKNVRISVDKKDKSVKSWRITDKSGKKTTYRVERFVPNVKINDTYFVFDKSKYPGVEVIDLR